MKTLYVIAASVVLAASSAAFADTSDNAGYAPRADIEDPAWVK
jgi:opacity protein-like surface antigen